MKVTNTVRDKRALTRES